MERRKRQYNTPYIIAALVLLFVTNIVSGITMAQHSHKIIHGLLDEKVTDIAKCAADLVDGDTVRDITEADIGTPEYEEQLEQIRIIMENVSADYVYIVRPVGDDKFVYILDPDPEEPADFGQEIVVSDALLNAAKGQTDVDDRPHKDEWGTFYSGYSPIYDSTGAIVAIAGCDCAASIHANIIKEHILFISFSALITLTFGIILAIMISSATRKRFNEMDGEMKDLLTDFEQLDALMRKSSRQRLSEMAVSQHKELLETLADGGGFEEGDRSRDDLSEVSDRLHFMRDSLRHYLSYIDSQTFVDPLTGAGNKPAYQQAIRSITDQITAGSANFAIAFFDINELKAINTKFGFERGDMLLFEAASMLKNIFQPKNVYRVASDEFIAVVENITPEDMAKHLTQLTSEMRVYNANHRGDAQLAMAKGTAFFDPETDTSYRTVFRRAEAMATQDKEAYYDRKREQETADDAPDDTPNP